VLLLLLVLLLFLSFPLSFFCYLVVVVRMLEDRWRFAVCSIRKLLLLLLQFL